MESPTVRERTFADIAATGVRWARVDLRWNGVERYGPVLASGRGDWSTMDAIVQAADRHGVRLLPIVAYTPAWASPHRESWAFPWREPFEEFFAAALRRYPQIPAWEVWNEPNLPVFAKPHPDPAGFVELLRRARETRDRVGSAAKLISGGLAAGGQIDIVAWVDEMARLGALDLVDGLGVHPYSGEEPDDPRAWMMRLEALHTRLAYLGAADLPLWYAAPLRSPLAGRGSSTCSGTSIATAASTRSMPNATSGSCGRTCLGARRTTRCARSSQELRRSSGPALPSAPGSAGARAGA
jgi:hypothetical protein